MTYRTLAKDTYHSGEEVRIEESVGKRGAETN
jgi:hypothetical protein